MCLKGYSFEWYAVCQIILASHNHKYQTGCLNIRNAGTLRLLQRTKNLMLTPKACADHIALRFKVGSMSTNCTYMCLFNVIIGDDVGSFQTSMSDTMGVQGFQQGLSQFAESQASSWHHGKASSL